MKKMAKGRAIEQQHSYILKEMLTSDHNCLEILKKLFNQSGLQATIFPHLVHKFFHLQDCLALRKNATAKLQWNM